MDEGTIGSESAPSSPSSINLMLESNASCYSPPGSPLFDLSNNILQEEEDLSDSGS